LQTGLSGTAEVLTIVYTDALVNLNPVVKMKLKVQLLFGYEFETEVQTAVSKIAVPRVGDKLNIKYNLANTTESIII